MAGREVYVGSEDVLQVVVDGELWKVPVERVLVMVRAGMKAAEMELMSKNMVESVKKVVQEAERSSASGRFRRRK